MTNLTHSRRSFIKSLTFVSIGYFIKPISTVFAESNGEDFPSIGGVVTVKQFGAKGDNLTDDTLSIANAIQYASSNGLRLKFESGIYIVNPLRLPAKFPTKSTYAFDILDNMNLFGEGNVVLKVKDYCSSDANPKWFTMFFSSTNKQNIRITGITFDGNWKNNTISPNRTTGSYHLYNQAFFAFFGDSAYGNNISISDCTFKNNAGTNNIICAAPQNQTATTLGSNWEITNTKHIDGGMDTGDFTAIFGYAENLNVYNNSFTQSIAPSAFNGSGARNAFEVHGARITFHNNSIRNYFGGVIVNSNWSRPVNQIVISNNTFSNMFLYGIRLWRQKGTSINQSPIYDVAITNNIIELNNTPYSVAETYKAGIIGTAFFQLGMSNITISNNQITAQHGMQNLSAAVYILGQAGSTSEILDNFNISENKSTGTYNGIVVHLNNNGAHMGELKINNNQIKNLINVGKNVNPIAISVNANSPIIKASITNNIVDDDYLSQTKYGIWLQGTINTVELRSNKIGHVSIAYAEPNLQVISRQGDDLRTKSHLGGVF